MDECKYQVRSEGQSRSLVETTPALSYARALSASVTQKSHRVCDASFDHEH